MKILEIQNVSKVFADGTCALNKVSFAINQGDFLVIGGSNGSGKSVLMSIIAELEDPSDGEVLNHCAKFGISEKIGLVFQDQDAQILGGTVADDVRFGLKSLKLPKEHIAEIVDKTLQDCGIFHKKHAPARLLSGGEKRRLAVAGVLAMSCEVIIFDEPFANLDWQGVKDVCAILQKLKQSGKTLIVLTHELEKIIGLANKFVVLNKGEIRFDGTPAQGLTQDLAQWNIRNPLVVNQQITDLVWL